MMTFPDPPTCPESLYSGQHNFAHSVAHGSPSPSLQGKVERFTKALLAKMPLKLLPGRAPGPRMNKTEKNGPDTSSLCGPIEVDIQFIEDGKQEEEEEEEEEEDEAEPKFLVLDGNFVTRTQTPSSRVLPELPMLESPIAESPIPNEQVMEPVPALASLKSIDRVIDDVYGIYRQRTASVAGAVNNITEQEWRKHFRLVKNLSPGNQGRVDLYTVVPSRVAVIVKKIKPTHSARIIPKEVTINRYHLVDHSSIVNRYATFFDHVDSTFNIAMEYCSGGDLYDFSRHWLAERREAIPEIFMLHFVASMGEALGWIHLGKRIEYGGPLGLPEIVQDDRQKALLHRDIKLDNIFLRWGPSNRYGMPDLVLGDFGGAAVEGARSDDVAFGTSDYWAPEVDDVMNAPPGTVFRVPVMTRASDMYTIGTTMFYMLEFYARYSRRMGNASLARYWATSTLCNWPILFDFIHRCLAYHPEDRPKTEELFNLVPVLRTHIRFLYEHGVRMPENSWPSASRHEQYEMAVPKTSSSAFVENVEEFAPPVGFAEFRAQKSTGDEKSWFSAQSSPVELPAQRSYDPKFDGDPPSSLLSAVRASPPSKEKPRLDTDSSSVFLFAIRPHLSPGEEPPTIETARPQGAAHPATSPRAASPAPSPLSARDDDREEGNNLVHISPLHSSRSSQSSLPESPRLLFLYKKFGLAPRSPTTDAVPGIPRYEEVVDISAPVSRPRAPSRFPSLRAYRMSKRYGALPWK